MTVKEKTRAVVMIVLAPCIALVLLPFFFLGMTAEIIRDNVKIFKDGK